MPPIPHLRITGPWGSAKHRSSPNLRPPNRKKHPPRLHRRNALGGTAPLPPTLQNNIDSIKISSPYGKTTRTPPGVTRSSWPLHRNRTTRPGATPYRTKIVIWRLTASPEDHAHRFQPANYGTLPKHLHRPSSRIEFHSRPAPIAKISRLANENRSINEVPRMLFGHMALRRKEYFGLSRAGLGLFASTRELSA